MDKRHASQQSSFTSVSGGHLAGASWSSGGELAAAQVWPNASTMLPNAQSNARSLKLRAVDSVPDNSVIGDGSYADMSLHQSSMLQGGVSASASSYAPQSFRQRGHFRGSQLIAVALAGPPL